MRDSICLFIPFWERHIMIDTNPQAYRLHLGINGFSHGLTNCPPDSLLPRLRRGRPLESATPVKRKSTTRLGGAFLLAEDEGFEPPQTESESGVLPLHKSSKRNNSIIHKPQEKSIPFLKKFQIIFPRGRACLPGPLLSGSGRSLPHPHPGAW